MSEEWGEGVVPEGHGRRGEEAVDIYQSTLDYFRRGKEVC